MKKSNRILLLLAVIFAMPMTLSAQMKWNSAYQQYIDQYKDIAIEQMMKYQIPASITLDQAVLE